MELFSTPYASYWDIDVDEIDLYEDALGLNSEFNDVFGLLGKLKVAPDERVTKILFEKIRKQN